MVKVVTFFLIAMMVLAIMGRLRLPKIGGKIRKTKIADARKCPDCGSYILRDGDCPCHKK